jgi:steroid 5-alpha reductase family enzyme
MGIIGPAIANLISFSIYNFQLMKNKGLLWQLLAYALAFFVFVYVFLVMMDPETSAFFHRYHLYGEQLSGPFWYIIGGKGMSFIAFLSQYTIWNLLLPNLAATLVIFLFSVIFRNSSFYDPYWSVVPVWIAAGWFLWGNQTFDATRAYLLMALIVLYALRLTINWVRGWPGLHHQDWRYDDIKQKTGKAYWLVSFLGIHYFPTMIVFASMMVTLRP